MTPRRLPPAAVCLAFALCAARAGAEPPPDDAWNKAIQRGVRDEGGEVESAEQAALRRAYQQRPRFVLHLGPVTRTGAGPDSHAGFGLGVGLGVGVRWGLADRWDFLARATIDWQPAPRPSGLFQYGDEDEPNLLLAAAADVGFRLRPVAPANAWYLGLQVHGGAAYANGLMNGEVYKELGGTFGGTFETGAVFGALEQWDIGVRTSAGYPFIRVELSLGYAF